MDGEIDTKNDLHNNYVQVKSEPNVYEMKILMGTDSKTIDGSVDTESRETTKSFQNLDVLIKEEPGTYDTRGLYSSTVTEGIDHQSGTSGLKDLHVHVHKETSCCVSHETDYAVCIKYEPTSCEVSKSYHSSGPCSTTNLGTSHDQPSDIDGTPGRSHCYENRIHISDNVFSRDVQVSCGPIKWDITGHNNQNHSTEHSVTVPLTCDNIDNSVHTHDKKENEEIYGLNCSVNIPKRTCLDPEQHNCDMCSFSSVSSIEMMAHKQRHTGIGEKRYKCDVCSYKTARSRNLIAHKRKHTGEKPYKCDVCSYSSNESNNLARHKRNHTGQKPYKCDVCSYSTSWSGALVVHKRKHTGEKPYKCDVCSYSSTESNNLARHKRNHTGQKPYKCDVCSYSTTRSDALVLHKRKHTGEKPYKCDMCSYSTARSSDLVAHKRKHTRKKPYKVDVCS